MQPNVLLTRAVSHEFIGRKYKQLLLIFAIVAVISILIAIWLVTLSAWWLLLAVPVILAMVVVSLVFIIGRFILTVTRPTLTVDQAAATHNFVDKLERVAEHVQTPVFIIVLKILIDVIRKPKRPYIHEVVEEGASLKPEFTKLQKLF